MGSSPVDEAVRKYAKYPSHLAENDRLEAIKAYIRHELASLCSCPVSEIPLFRKLKGCQNRDQSAADSDCSKVYEEVCDLFYALSLIYKRKFIAKELTAENCKWTTGWVKLKDLVLSVDVGDMKYKLLAEVVKDENLLSIICERGKDYGEKKRQLADDRIIIVVEEKGKYRILDGNGRAFYHVYKNGCDEKALEAEVGAYIGRCGNGLRGVCTPFGIYHFIGDAVLADILTEDQIRNFIKEYREATTNNLTNER